MVSSSREKRQSERHLTADKQTEHGRFCMYIHNEQYEITEIQDVSISGVKISVDTLLPEGTPLTLSYQDEELDILLESEVIWSELNIETEQFQAGIKFCPLQGDLATLFFLAFRQQLDLFDQNRLLQQA